MLLDFFKNIFNFTGTASRREYWLTILFSSLSFLPFYLLLIPGLAVPSSENPESSAPIGIAFAIVYLLAAIVYYIATLSLLVRRIRDTGKSPWVVLVLFIPFVGIFYIFYLTVIE